MFHIFILDDDVADSALLLLAFKRARPNTSVYTVSDSRLLPAYLDTKSPVENLRSGVLPHILVLPAEMSFYTGLETVAWIRGQARFDTMFVVMLSSRDDPAERERAELAGVDAFHVRFPGKKDLVQLAEDILQEYTLRQSEGVESAHALAPAFATAI